MREDLDRAREHCDLACGVPAATKDDRKPIIRMVAFKTIANVRLVTLDGIVDKPLRLKLDSQ